MNKLLELMFVFLFCTSAGWLLEVAYRSTMNKRLINPGFLVGPALPIYGTGGLVLYLLCSMKLSFIHNNIWRGVFIVAVAIVVMTAIEYVAGIVSVKVYKNKLWDYSKRWGNIQGVICPLFSAIWGVCSLLFMLFIYPWLSKLAVIVPEHTILVLLVGLYYGVFLVDLCYSLHIMSKVRTYAIKVKELVNFENFKRAISEKYKSKKGKPLFAFSFNIYNRISRFVEEHKLSKNETVNVDIKEPTVTNIELEEKTKNEK